MPVRAYYADTCSNFLAEDASRILGYLAEHHQHALEEAQRSAWQEQITTLKVALSECPSGHVFLEFSIPRMGKRADAVFLFRNIAFVLEFKVGAERFLRHDLLQAQDYALDLKNFHEGSHHIAIVPVLIATAAPSQSQIPPVWSEDLVADVLKTNAADLGHLLTTINCESSPALEPEAWIAAGYRPTPTIIEAAQVLYRSHSVADITRKDAAAINLQQTSDAINDIIGNTREKQQKAICFITGVPGSGKTLAGLNIAALHSEDNVGEKAVFLSGNGPLVIVLREALARDRAKQSGVSKGQAKREVSSFVQNIHHFRDEYLRNTQEPTERVVIFDEAQRAWNRQEATAFVKRKHGIADFNMSEPEFLISVMDRHTTWCVVICLVGGGQEINKGEAGIVEWMDALDRRFTDWQVFVSSRITSTEYGDRARTDQFLKSPRVHTDDHLHLAVSMRSFRAEALSEFVGYVVNDQPEKAREAYQRIEAVYPIVLTRDLNAARQWLRQKARGSERFGLVASSGAHRLRAEGLHLKSRIDPAVWFLNSSGDVRSSCFLEETGSEFDVQGLELDWAGVCWDGDLHHDGKQWVHQNFKGTKWLAVKSTSRRSHLTNAYRVLLTRARQGMVLFIPNGGPSDNTRLPSRYDGTSAYLQACGIPTLSTDTQTPPASIRSIDWRPIGNASVCHKPASLIQQSTSIGRNSICNSLLHISGSS